MQKVPKRLIVVGAGVIGLELGSVWRRLGSEVMVVQSGPMILNGIDLEIAGAMKRILEKQGMKFKMNAKILSATKKTSSAVLTIGNTANQTTEAVEADAVLLSIGRKPHTANMGLQELGVDMDPRGTIRVDKHFQTSVRHVYAIGDAIPGPMLAHKAEEEGVACVEHIAGKKGHVNYDVIPGVIYTHPEVASVGKTEQELKQAGVPCAVSRFPMLANSRARAIGEPRRA